MKKLAIVALAVVGALSLAACNGNDDPTTSAAYLELQAELEEAVLQREEAFDLRKEAWAEADQLAAEATQWRLNAEDRTTERDAARSQRDEARAEVDSLTANVATLENQVTSLSERNEQLQEDLAAAREQLSWERLDEVPSGSEGQSYDWLTGTSPSETVEERAARLSQEPSIRPVDRLCYEHVPETYSINFCDSQALRFGGGTPEVLGI